MPGGLSATFASLKLGGLGSRAEAKAFRWRGAGDGVPMPAPGSSGSAGSPWCGARKATERKKGRARGARRRMTSTAFARVDVGLVAGVRRQRSVLVERVAGVAIRGGVDGAVPLGPPRWDLQGVAGPVSVQVLADVSRAVTGVLQPDGERARVVELRVAAGRRAVPEDAVVVGVLPGEKARAGRAALGIDGEAPRECRPAPGQQAPDVRHHPQRPGGLVVRHHHHDVRPGRLGLDGRELVEGSEEQGRRGDECGRDGAAHGRSAIAPPVAACPRPAPRGPRSSCTPASR